MIWLDVVLLAFLIWNLLGGILRGAVRELVNLAAVVAGILLASRLGPLVGSLLGLLWPAHKPLMNVLGFLGALLLIYGALSLVGFFLRKVLKALSLGWVDRVAGGALGLLKGLAFSAAFLIVLAQFPFKGVQEAFEVSLIAPLIFPLVKLVLSLFPVGAVDAVLDFARKYGIKELL